MPYENIPPFKAGQPVPARRLDKMREVVESSDVTASEGMHVSKTPAGTHIGLTHSSEILVKITGSLGSGKYQGQEQYPVSGGGYVAGIYSFTSSYPLQELNNNTTITTNTIVRAWLPPTSNVWVFQRGACPS